MDCLGHQVALLGREDGTKDRDLKGWKDNLRSWIRWVPAKDFRDVDIFLMASTCTHRILVLVDKQSGKQQRLEGYGSYLSNSKSSFNIKPGQLHELVVMIELLDCTLNLSRQLLERMEDMLRDVCVVPPLLLRVSMAAMLRFAVLSLGLTRRKRSNGSFPYSVSALYLPPAIPKSV